jgi:hypothetical protein
MAKPKSEIINPKMTNHGREKRWVRRLAKNKLRLTDTCFILLPIKNKVELS